MPDQYGRPTMADGLQLAQAISWANKENEQQQNKLTEKQSYEVANAIESGKDISSFPDEARYKGAQLAFQNKINGLKVENQKILNSTEGMQKTMTRLKLNLEQADQRLRQYKAARAAGDDATAKQIAIQLNNENMYTGRYVEPAKDGGGYDIISQKGSNEKIKDLPMQTVDQVIGSYFDRPQQEIMSWQFKGEQFRRQHNEEVLSKATPLYNKKTGQVIYRVPAGAWGKDGRPRGAFFTDAQGNEVPSNAAKGFMKMKEAIAVSGLKLNEAKTSASIAASKASGAKELASITAAEKNRRPSAINPKNIAAGPGGQHGLIMQGPEGLSFQPVNASAIDTTGKQESNQYALKTKQLSTELMPFTNNSNQPIWDENGNLTTVGKNALKAALALMERAQSQNGQPLTSQEQVLLPHAQRAWEMYQSINSSTPSSNDPFGIRQSGQTGLMDNGGVSPPSDWNHLQH